MNKEKKIHRPGGYVSYSQEEETKEKKSSPTGGKIIGRGKIVKHELLPFTQKLAALSEAGVPLIESLSSLRKQTDHPGMQVLLTEIDTEINAGLAFSQCLQKYPDIFNTLYVSIVNAGEQSGDLPGALQRLADYMEDSAELRRKVKSAMMYPSIVISAAILITIGLVVFIVPKFVSMFEDFGSELPLPTQMLVALSDFFRDQWFVAVASVITVRLLWKLSLKSELWALKVSAYYLSMPQFGKLITMIVMARFSRTMSSLIGSGMPIINSLKIVGASSGNLFVSSKMNIVITMVESGSTLGDAMTHVNIFPKMMLQMVSTGESTGRVDQMLNKVANYYEKEVKAMLEGLSSIIEPILMLIVGAVIGGIAFAMFMPIFSLGDAVLG
ncbi:MAG: type II secretion system F family protein [Lentisphaeraceae bacterium]|nr:type II secretion system F family protein [Lentisphaeraceae bacterium]